VLTLSKEIICVDVNVNTIIFAFHAAHFVVFGATFHQMLFATSIFAIEAVTDSHYDIMKTDVEL